MTKTPKPEERAPYTIEQDDTQGLITPPFWLTGPGIERTFIRDRHTAELVQYFAKAAHAQGVLAGQQVERERGRAVVEAAQHYSKVCPADPDTTEAFEEAGERLALAINDYLSTHQPQNKPNE